LGEARRISLLTAQRFSATISDDGNTISGRWEKSPDGRTWETDFDLTYRKAR
jgi:hypothetical protein